MVTLANKGSIDGSQKKEWLRLSAERIWLALPVGVSPFGKNLQVTFFIEHLFHSRP
jgi:hypothetical protein